MGYYPTPQALVYRIGSFLEFPPANANGQPAGGLFPQSTYTPWEC
jgi:hypothetical protein